MPLIPKKEGSRFWWCRFWVANKEYRRSTGETDRRKAEAVERRLRAEAEAAAPPRGTERRTLRLSDLAGLDYERAATAGRREPSLKMIEYQWKTIIGYLGDLPADAINYTVAQRYVAGRRAPVEVEYKDKHGKTRKRIRKARNQSIRRELVALRRGLKLAIRHGALFRMPQDWPQLEADEVDERREGKLHPWDVLLRWLGALRPTAPDAHDEAWFALLTGLRAKEIKRIEQGWVTKAPPGVGVPALLRLPASGTKTRKARTIGLTPPALAILHRRVDAKPHEPLIFSQGSHKTAYRAAARRIEYKKVITLRDLRATHMTLAIEEGADPTAAQAAAGHAQLATTQKYLKSRIERTALVGVKVEGALRSHGVLPAAEILVPDRHSDTGTVDEREPQVLERMVGRGRIERPTNGLKVRYSDLENHLSACFYCQQVVAQCLSGMPVDGHDRHICTGTGGEVS
jgi:site-specific recombinase XerC